MDERVANKEKGLVRFQNMIGMICSSVLKTTSPSDRWFENRKMVANRKK